MDNLSAGEVGGIFAGIVALLAAIGKGLAWAVGWADRRDENRAAKLKAWEESLNRRELDQRKATGVRLRAMETALTLMRRALLDVTGELRQHAPRSEALANAELALRTAFPIEWDMPAELEDLLHKFDEGKKP